MWTFKWRLKTKNAKAVHQDWNICTETIEFAKVAKPRNGGRGIAIACHCYYYLQVLQSELRICHFSIKNKLKIIKINQRYNIWRTFCFGFFDFVQSHLLIIIIKWNFNFVILMRTSYFYIRLLACLAWLVHNTIRDHWIIIESHTLKTYFW